MLRDHLERQAALTERAPTEAQKAAGNYRKGRVKAHGLEVVIENARGSTRSGKGPDGKPWKCRLPCHYGYIRRTEGADGDQVDVYVGPHLKSAKVFVLDQRDADSGAWDEHKVFFGFNSPRHVLNTYRQAFSDGKADQRLGAVTEMTVDQFKNWLKTGDTTKPMHRASGGRVARANIKLGRDAFLYLDSTSDRFAQCGTCRFGHDHCAIMNGTKVDPKNGSCGYYIKGAPIGHPIADMTKEQVGYVDHPVRCENCRYFDHGTCKLYAELNREFPNQFDLDTKVHPKACCNAQVPRTGRAHGGRVGYADGGDVMDLGGEGNFLTRLGEMEFSPGTTFGNRLFGTGGEERYQTWPEKMIRSGFTLPGDVAAGKFETQPSVPGQWSDEDEARRDLNQQELLARAQDTAGMAGGTAFGAADSSVASLGAGPIRQAAREPFLEAAVRVGDRLYKGVDHLDALSKVPPEYRQAAAFDGTNRGWVNDRGRFLNREKAQQYAVTNDLIREDAPSWVATAPEAVAEWIKPRSKPETLLSDSGKPGSAIAGARRAQLPMDEASRMARAAEQGFEGPWYHGGLRMDRFTESGKIDPRRATSGPMPYFTDNPEMASAYAMGKKPDTSLLDEGRVADYFTVHPKDLGWSSRARVPVEDTWRFLSPEQRAEIAARAKRIGYANPQEGSGPLTLHPEGARDVTLSDSHYDWILNNEARGNHLAALREMWHDSGEFVNDPGQLSEVYRLAGYPHQISETTAPWTEARGVTPARIRMTNPLDTTNTQVMTETVLPRLEEMFKRDRSRKAEFGADMWDKNHRYTPKEWIEQAKQDYANGENSYVWTSIPDKITNALRSLGYDGILDTGGKMGGMGHTVAIPFGPEQVRSQFARFDPKNLGKSGLLLEDAAAPGAPLSALEKAPPFFSAVERAVDAIPQAKMTGDQWLGTLSNKPGVKPEEMEWTGLANFLAERKGQPVTKQEIAEHLGDNQVRLNEVWKGADPEALAKAQELAQSHGNSWDDLSPTDRQRYMQRVRGNRLTDQVPGDTRYHQYQLPGGENYREMLLTLPLKSQAEGAQAAAFARSMNEKYGDRWVSRMSPEELARYESLIDAQEAVDRTATPYKSSHWDEPNIVAHMRMNDRSMAVPFTPEETAAIEARRAAQGQLDSIRAQQADVAREITATVKPLEQARRAQIIADNKAGKLSNGDAMRALEEYHPHPEIEPLQNRLQELRAQEDQLRASLPPEPKQRQARSLHLEEIQSDWHQQGRERGYNVKPKVEIKPEQFEGREVYRVYVNGEPKMAYANRAQAERFAPDLTPNAVPDAPFKKTWHELALKRALREAAEGGYDRLSWTPGDAQAARYDLSKTIDQINYDKKSGYLEAVDKNGVKHITSVVPEAKLADHIGKEAAEKLLKTEPNDRGVSILRNADLKIGGEGMRGFYDQMIPKSIEKIAKQYGVKAQKGELAAPSLENMSGQQAPSLNAERKAHPVWYIDIPQSLKDQARSKGFSLFEDSAVAGAPLSAVAKQDNPRAWMESILKKGRERKQLAENLAESGNAVRLSHEDGRYAMAGPDMSKPGSFRLTRFDDRGPSGHTEHPTLAEAVDEGLRMKYMPLLEDSSVFGTPLSAMRWDPLNDPNYKIQAIKKRGQGIPTGKSAKGWDFKRPDPAKGSWDRHVAEVRAAWNNDRSRILNDYLEQTNSMMTPDDWAFIQSDDFRAQGGRVDMAGAPTFDPDKPFDVVEPAFDPSQPFEEVKPDAGAMSAAGRGAYQGATFGFGDELRGIGEAGGVKPDEWNDPISVMKGAYRYWTGAPGAEESYEAGAKREREANKLAKEQHPYAYMGGEFAGAIPSMMALPGGVAARGATLATRMRQGALVGSEYGALSGAGDGEDAASRAVGAGAGAVAGGAGGALAAPLTEGAGYFLKRTLGPVWNSVVGLTRGSEAEAARRLFTAAEADSADIAAGKMTGLTPAQWQAAKAAGEPVTLADFGGTRVQSLLRSAANTSPEGRGTLEKAFGDRFEGQAERVAQDVRGLVSGGANAHKTADQLVAEYDVARIPAYRKAFAQPGAQGMWDDEFAQMAQAPVVGQAIRMATVNGRNEAAKLGLKPPVNPFQFNKDGTVTLTDPNFTPNLQFWDVVKKNLDKMGADGNAWSKVLRGKLDEAVPEYGQARGIAAQFFGERDALEAGRQLAGKRVDAQVVAGLMRKMSPEEKDLFREGFASDWAGRVIGGFRDSRDITKAMFNSPNEREMARVLFGDAGLRKLQARMTLEAVMDGARKAMGNSTTARQLIEAGLAGGALGGYLDGDWKGAVAGAAGAAGARRALASEMAAGARKLIGKVDSATAARVADLLTSDDPRKLAQGLRIMVSNQKVADGMRALADRLANAGQETGIPRLHIDTTGWGGSLPARADQNQDQPQGLGQQ